MAHASLSSIYPLSHLHTPLISLILYIITEARLAVSTAEEEKAEELTNDIAGFFKDMELVRYHKVYEGMIYV
jgi:Asp-tRNA(Asn)/Glu-tRNA(Gln) amidotransferase C subunit